jgi:hypothetical protein
MRASRLHVIAGRWCGAFHVYFIFSSEKAGVTWQGNISLFPCGQQ